MVSVILRSRNEERYIGFALQSLHDFFGYDLEIVLVDNESTDNTIRVVNSFEYLDIKKTNINKNDYTPGKALNLGLQNCSGEIVLCMSSHCQITNLNFNKIKRKLQDNVAVWGKQIPIWDGKNFRVGDARLPILEYSENLSGWSEDLTTLHEDASGKAHPIDIASRKMAVNSVKKYSSSCDQSILEIGCSSGYLLEDLKWEFKKSQIIVKQEKLYFRPNEVHNLVGDFRKARKILKWKPLTNFDKLISEMIDADLKEIF